MMIFFIFHAFLGFLAQPLIADIYDTSPFSPDRLNTFYDLFMIDQKEILDEAFHRDSDQRIGHPPPGKLGYAPLVITNNTGLDPSRIYIVGKGQTIAATDAYFLQPNLKTGVCTLVSSAIYSSADPSISVPLSSLPSAGRRSYYLYVPQMISGRFYLSVDTPLYMETTIAAGTGYRTINDPSQTTIQDPNYYTLYQDFEYTLDKNYDLFANVTNVDYFAIPMTLGSHTYPSGTFYKTLDDLLIVGYPVTSSRSSILNSIVSGLTSGDASSPPQWNRLSIPFYANPYAASSPLTYLRILAAKQSIALASSLAFQGAANPQTYFNSNYLQTTSTGLPGNVTYMEALYNYYNTGGHQLQFSIFPAGYSEVTYTMTSDSGSPGILNLVSSAPPAPALVTVDLNNLTTESLLSGAIGNWVTDVAITPTNTDPWQTEIAKLLSALFTAGMLPPASSVTQPIISSDQFFANYRSSYFANPTTFSLGPWYNLYDKIIHPLLLKTDGFGLGYAYDFDDLLDIAGLMHVNIQKDGVLNPYEPYMQLSAGPIDTSIPNPTANFGPYTLGVSILPSGSNPIDIIYSTDSSPPNMTLSLDSSPHTLNNLQNEFLVRYYTDGTKLTYLTYRVYPKYQLVLPVTDRYNHQDTVLMNGIVFVSGTDGSTFNINLPDTNPFPSP